MVECPDCDGAGLHFFAFDTKFRQFKRVTELAYDILPMDEDDARESNLRWCQGYAIPCDTCHGDGEIPEDY